MKRTFLIGTAAAFIFVAPAAAKPGNAHGYGHGHDFGLERGQAARDWDRHDPIGYGAGGCPPGLAKKHNGCMPPGHARRRGSQLSDWLSKLNPRDR